MVLLKSFALIPILWQLTIPTSFAKTYVVNGCFSSLQGRTTYRYFGRSNSNYRCQRECKRLKFIIAATKRSSCTCGNLYPDGKKVDDSMCNTSCRAYSNCHNPSSCCGGRNSYSVSIVGGINIAKHVLQRLAKLWQTNRAYRTDMEGLANIPSRSNHIEDWSHTFDHLGWSTCGHGRYMLGMYRNSGKSFDRIGLIEKVDCYDAPGYLYSSSDDRDCYHEDWQTFNQIGWSKCKNGYYMAGLYRSSGDRLYNIETALCCRPNTQVKQWGYCQTKNVWNSFNNEGWSDCPSGYYMAGLYRSSCDELYCLEEYHCCKMGSYIGPKLVVRLKDLHENLKKCSMNAMDKSLTARTFKCINIPYSNAKILKLNAKKFKLTRKAPFKKLKFQSIANFRPVICSSLKIGYNCRKQLTVSVSEASTLTTTFGTSSRVTLSSNLEVSSGGIFLPGIKASFSSHLSKTKSLYMGEAITKERTIADTTDVTVYVLPNNEITINLMRSVQDLTYKWKAEIELDGLYSIEWSKSVEHFEPVHTVLSGPQERINAFGTWKYPRTSVIKVMVTDKYGNKKFGCSHEAGKEEPSLCSFANNSSKKTTIVGKAKHFLLSLANNSSRKITRKLKNIQSRVLSPVKKLFNSCFFFCKK